jgi:hypothetical protein
LIELVLRLALAKGENLEEIHIRKSKSVGIRLTLKEERLCA